MGDILLHVCIRATFTHSNVFCCTLTAKLNYSTFYCTGTFAVQEGLHSYA